MFHRFAVPAEPSTATWTGPWVEPGFEIHEVIPSWNAETPPGSLVEVELQARTQAGSETRLVHARPVDLPGRGVQADVGSRPGRCVRQRRHGYVPGRGCPLVAYRLRFAPTVGGREPPVVRLLGAIASSALPPAGDVSAHGGAGGVGLNVPTYAQSAHEGEYPQYGGGGAAWCSPTSTAMVMEYWGSGPAAVDLAWIDPALADPCVDHAARFTFDAAYDGTGNWPFNTAYAAHFGLDAFVTRLRSLQEAELFLAAGIPLVASIAAEPSELDGFCCRRGQPGISSSSVSPPREIRSSTILRRPRMPRCAAATTGHSSSAPGSTARAERSTWSRRPAGPCRRHPGTGEVEGLRGGQCTRSVACMPRARWSASVHHI